MKLILAVLIDNTVDDKLHTCTDTQIQNTVLVYTDQTLKQGL